jgi:hypothetical protein
MKNELNQIGDLMFKLRETDNAHFDACASLCKSIVDLLVSLREQGVTRSECFDTLMKWNTNTKDGKEIRSRKSINNWLRDAGFRARAERSDTGTVKTDKKGETREQALARIKSLMAQHGITTADLA